jgi:hypothetical protein
MVAAGTVLGLSAQLLAQSAAPQVVVEGFPIQVVEGVPLQPAQKAEVKAQKKAQKAAQKAKKRTQSSQQRSETRTFVFDGGDGPKEAVVEHFGEGHGDMQAGGPAEVEVFVETPDGQPGERRVRVQARRVDGAGHGGGGHAAHVCPTCGCSLDNGDDDGEDRVIELRGFGMGQGQGPREMEWREGAFEPAPGARVRGRAIVIGPDGQQREFNFGGEPGGPGEQPRIMRFRGMGDGQEFNGHAQGLRRQGVPIPPPPPAPRGPHGQGGWMRGEQIQGKVIIITPDGRQEFDLGAPQHGPRGEGFGVHRDGENSAEHQDVVRVQSDDGRVMKVRRIRSGNGPL